MFRCYKKKQTGSVSESVWKSRVNDQAFFLNLFLLLVPLEVNIKNCLFFITIITITNTFITLFTYYYYEFVVTITITKLLGYCWVLFFYISAF